jgi:hypothetical protein
MPEEKLDKIEELKTKLFNKNYQVRPEYRVDFTYHRPKKEVPDSWEKKENKEVPEKNFFLKTSMFKKFFIFSIIIFVLAMGYALYTFFAGSNDVSNDNIEISVLGDAFAAGGEQLPLQIEIVNKNSSPLELADLVVEYPKGSPVDNNNDAQPSSSDQNSPTSSSLNVVTSPSIGSTPSVGNSSSAGVSILDNSASVPTSPATDTLRTSIGTIPAGGTEDENVKIVLFGEQGSVQPLTISLEYRVENSNAIFVKEIPYQVTISSTPINLSIDAPVEANPNQEITLNVKAILNSTNPTPDMLLRADYPIGFEFESATPAPSFGNNVWALGDLPPGAEKDIAITGKMVDVADGEQKNFHIFSGSESDSDKSVIGTVFNSLGYMMTIKKASVEANLYINGVYQEEYATDSKTTVSGEIRWTNNLDTQLDDLSIVAKISGNAFDPKSVSAANGFYNSSDSTITWDKNTEGDFAQVAPGASGAVDFSVSPSALFSDSTGMLSEPLINIDVSIKGDNAIEGNAVQELDNSESKVIKIISDVGLAAKALYYSGPFTNSGPIPPKVGGPTTYTIVWTLSNTSNNISNAQVKATLPAWMSFVGPISPPEEDLTYDPATEQITWNVGGIPTGTGITAADREVAFQVSLDPSLSQVGTSPILINDAVLTGHDDFANVDITVNKDALNTYLFDDSSFPAEGDRVTD